MRWIESVTAERVDRRLGPGAVMVWVSRALGGLWFGIGFVVVQRIVAWCARHGRFTRVGQVRAVDGIRPDRFGRPNLVVVR